MEKSEARKYYKSLRSEMTSEVKSELENQLFELLKSGFQWENKKVSVFLPIARFNEINTWHFIENEVKTTFAVPVIRLNNELVHIQLESKDQLETSSWGIPEPYYGELLNEFELDIVIVPLLAYDEQGGRVGYGAGFYDRFLVKCNPDCLFVGISLFDPLHQIEDLNENDIRLHYCVSPKQIWTFK